MPNCWLCLGAVMLPAAMCALAVGYIAPYWTGDSGGYHAGLLAQCSNGKNCQWFWANNFEMEKKHPDWHKAVVALFGIGLLFAVIAFVLAYMALCCGSCRESGGNISTLSCFLILAFLLTGIALVVYGVKKDLNIDQYLWGFYVAITGCGLCLLTTFMFSCYGCSLRRA